MKRLVLIFLLVLLPLQMSWAAVTIYCGHEQGTASRHFGHHSHQHKAQASDEKQSKDVKPKIDPDCAFCHQGWTKLAMGHIFTPAPPMHQDHVVFDAAAYHSHIPDGPRRPNWQAAS